MTELKSIFVNKEIKGVIGLHKSMKGFADFGSALEDLLNESPKYLKLKEAFKILEVDDEN